MGNYLKIRNDYDSFDDDGNEIKTIYNKTDETTIIYNKTDQSYNINDKIILPKSQTDIDVYLDDIIKIGSKYHVIKSRRSYEIKKYVVLVRRDNMYYVLDKHTELKIINKSNIKFVVYGYGKNILVQQMLKNSFVYICGDKYVINVQDELNKLIHIYSVNGYTLSDLRFSLAMCNHSEKINIGDNTCIHLSYNEDTKIFTIK